VFHVTVVRFLGTEAVALRRSTVPSVSVPDLLSRFPDPVHLYQILQDHYGLVATGAVQSFKAVAATRSDAHPLGLRTGEAIMLWHGIIYTGQGTPLARVRTVFRGDRFRFVISQGRDMASYIPDDVVGIGSLDTIAGSLW
jgi:GntR family transcriptional regulator